MKSMLRASIAGALLATSLIATAPAVQAAPATAHCATVTGSVKVESYSSPMTVQVPDTRTGELVTVTVTITGSTFKVTTDDPAVELVDAAWCVKSSTKVNSGTGTTGASTSTNKKGVVQAISYVVLSSVTTEEVAPAIPCDAATTSGGAGVTQNTMELGKPGPTSFNISYETYNIPDRIEVFYEGKRIADTGYVGDDNTPPDGTGSITVSVPAGTSTKVMIQVTGPDYTAWDFTPSCPV